jgi:hypothetical protein
MTDVGWLLIGFGVTVVIGGAIAIWFLVPAFQCPVCNSYKVKELETELGKMLHCENEECKAEWRAM